MGCWTTTPEFLSTLPSPQGDVEEYLYSRGVSSAQMRTFGLKGFRGKTLDPVLLKGGPSFLSDLEGDHVLFPLTTVLGDTFGFQSRSIEGKVYNNHADDKASPSVFGYAQALAELRRLNRSYFILVEGVFDLFPIQRHDPCVLAIMTAGVSPALVRSLLRWVDTLYLCFDSDPQGIKITADTVRQLSDQFSHVHDISIPRKYGIKDVGALWEKGGDDYVRSVLALPSRLSRVEGTNANPLFRC